MDLTRKGKLFIQTYSGIKFFPFDPHPDIVDIRDIAHALTRLCRFNGHINRFYSVALHSILVSEMVPEEDALWGLLHDATEAYVGDMVRPLKWYFGEFEMLENGIMNVIGDKFGLPHEMPQSVKEADYQILHREARFLMDTDPTAAGWTIPACNIELKPIPDWSFEIVEETFLTRFESLTRTHVDRI